MDLEAPAVAEVEEVFESAVLELIAGVIGLEEGLEVPLPLLSHSQSRDLEGIHFFEVNVKSRFQKNHRTWQTYS